MMERAGYHYILCFFPTVEGIRLVDGSHPGEGRLEIQHGGVWGTICSDYFDFKDAMVACRRLGYK